MIDIEELKKLAEESLWTGDWYDAGCGTVHCSYVDQEKFGDYGEVAHPEPSVVSAFIAAANPKATLALIRELERKDSTISTISNALSFAESECAKYRSKAGELDNENRRLKIELEEARSLNSRALEYLEFRDEKMGGMNLKHGAGKLLADLRVARQQTG